jgi:hypothetical protein
VRHCSVARKNGVSTKHEDKHVGAPRKRATAKKTTPARFSPPTGANGFVVRRRRRRYGFPREGARAARAPRADAA